MSRSFLEADHQKKMADMKKKLAEIEIEISNMFKEELNSYLQPLIAYFDSANAYLKHRSRIMVREIIYLDYIDHTYYYNFLVSSYG